MVILFFSGSQMSSWKHSVKVWRFSPRLQHMSRLVSTYIFAQTLVLFSFNAEAVRFYLKPWILNKWVETSVSMNVVSSQCDWWCYVGQSWLSNTKYLPSGHLGQIFTTHTRGQLWCLGQWMAALWAHSVHSVQYYSAAEKRKKDQKHRQVYKNKTKHNKQRRSQTLLSPILWVKGQTDMVSPDGLSAYFLFWMRHEKTVLDPSWTHCGDRKALQNKHGGVKYLIHSLCPQRSRLDDLQGSRSKLL